MKKHRIFHISFPVELADEVLKVTKDRYGGISGFFRELFADYKRQQKVNELYRRVRAEEEAQQLDDLNRRLKAMLADGEDSA